MALTDLEQEIVAKAREALRAMARAPATSSKLLNRPRRPRPSAGEAYIDGVIEYLLAHGGDVVAASEVVLQDAFDKLKVRDVYAKAAAHKKLHEAIRVAFSQYRKRAKAVEVDHDGERYSVRLTIATARNRGKRRFRLHVVRVAEAGKQSARDPRAIAEPRRAVRIELRVFVTSAILHAYPFLPRDAREHARSCIWEVASPTGDIRRERAGVTMSWRCTIPGTYRVRAHVFLDEDDAPAYVADGVAHFAPIS